MSLAFIGLGSNLGKGCKNLQEAWHLLGEQRGITLLGLSSPYLTEPVDMESLQQFTNAVGVLETKLSPEQLLGVILSIEKSLGRDRALGQDRTVDLDIVYFDDLVLHTENLDLPHPEMHERLFVLAPLAELAPDRLHPVRNQTTRQMKLAASGQIVQKISWE